MAFPYPLSYGVKIPLWVFILLLFAGYISWETYWYTKVGLGFIKWHTHFVPILMVWFLLTPVVSLLTTKKEAHLSLGVIVFSLIAVEGFLMATGINKNYVENRTGYYLSLYRQQSNDSLRTYKPNEWHPLKTPEYDYKRFTNSYGFSDKPFQKPANQLVIQTYGDSFTKGDGAPADSSYPYLLGKMLGNGYLVQNYGICGNDPGFYPVQFEKVGKNYNPRLIILSYCTFDFITDVMSRGGMERFYENGWRTKGGPWWEVIYASSLTSRLVFHSFGIRYDDFFLNEEEKKARYKALEKNWNGIFVELAELAKRYNTEIFLFKKPERCEIDVNKYQFDMSFFDSLLANYPQIHHVDLLPKYRQKIKMDKGGSTSAYYYVKDGHHNPKGYLLMAQLIYESLVQEKILNTGAASIQTND